MDDFKYIFNKCYKSVNYSFNYLLTFCLSSFTVNTEDTAGWQQ